MARLPQALDSWFIHLGGGRQSEGSVFPERQDSSSERSMTLQTDGESEVSTSLAETSHELLEVLKRNCELRGTDNVQGQIFEYIHRSGGVNIHHFLRHICSMKWLEVFLLLPGGMLVHCKVTPSIRFMIYTPGWREAVWGQCLPGPPGLELGALDPEPDENTNPHSMSCRISTFPYFTANIPVCSVSLLMYSFVFLALCNSSQFILSEQFWRG